MFVKQWMSKNVVTATADSTIEEASELMEEHRIRRLPIIGENNQLIGILSSEDIKKALPSLIDGSQDDASRALARQATAGIFMTTTPLVVTPEDTMETAAMAMRKHKIGGIPVVKDGILLGIVTESDVFRALIEVLGGGEGGIRMELAIDQGAEMLHDCLDVFREHGADILAISLCGGFSKDKRLLTIRWRGADDSSRENVIDALWKLGAQITRVIDAEDSTA